jgi:hypothetical protein
MNSLSYQQYTRDKAVEIRNMLSVLFVPVMQWFPNCSLQKAEEYIYSGTEFHRDQSLPIILTFIAAFEEERPCH